MAIGKFSGPINPSLLSQLTAESDETKEFENTRAKLEGNVEKLFSMIQHGTGSEVKNIQERLKRLSRDLAKEKLIPDLLADVSQKLKRLYDADY